MTSPLLGPHEANFRMIGLDFSRDELDMVLYGYAKASERDAKPKLGVALSGLRIGELSYGKLRISEQSSGKFRPGKC